MKFRGLCLIAGSLFLSSHSQASDLLDIDTNYIKCQFVYENTGDLNRLEVCTSKALDQLDSIVKSQREKSNYKKKNEWQKTNVSLNKHLELCESNAIKSQKNSTIKKDILSCRFFHSRSLAYEASLIN